MKLTFVFGLFCSFTACLNCLFLSQRTKQNKTKNTQSHKQKNMQSKQHLIIFLPVSKPLLIVLQEACFSCPNKDLRGVGEMLIRGLALIAKTLADPSSLLKGSSHFTPLNLLLVSDTAR